MKHQTPLQLMLIPALVYGLAACQSSAPRDDHAAAVPVDHQMTMEVQDEGDHAHPILDESSLADLDSLDEQAAGAGPDAAAPDIEDTASSEEVVPDQKTPESAPPAESDTASRRGDQQEQDGVLMAVDEGASEAEIVDKEPQATYTIYVPVQSRTSVPEDPARLWLPPVESSLATIEIPLSEIVGVVDAARNQARGILSSKDHGELQGAYDELIRVQAAIYGLAVRMRSQWTQMEYQSFLSSIRFHEILELSNAISTRQSHLRHQAWAYTPAPAGK